MKKITLILTGVALSIFVYAQESEKGNKPKKIETIKIIDGDTVVHDVRIVEIDESHGSRHRRDIHREWVTNDIDSDLDSILENLDIYMHMDEGHKKMIIKRIDANGEDAEEMFRDLDIDEDIIIEMSDGKREMKVMKIVIDDEDIEEVTTIEMDNSKGGPEQNRQGKGRHELRERGDLKVFPNPAKDELNLEFIVEEGSEAELTVTGVNGEKIFSKTYKEGGNFKEKIKTDGSNKGVYIVNLNQKGRSETKKIILK